MKSLGLIFLALAALSTAEDPTTSLQQGEKEWLHDILVTRDMDVSYNFKKALDFHSSPAEEKGISYGSENLKVEIIEKVVSGDSYNATVILTRLPSTPIRKKMINDTGMFKTEIMVYRDVLSKLRLLMNEMSDYSESTWAPFIGYKQDYSAFAIKDVSREGFVRGDKITGLDMKHCKLALATLGKFHAMTAKLAERGTLNIADFDLSLLQRNRALIGTYVERVFEDFATLIETKWEPEWAEAAKKIRHKAKTLTQELININERSLSPFNVLNHGSYMTTKIQFTYGLTDVYTSPDPIAAKIVSYQMSFYNSPAFDLQFFMNTSPNIDIMINHRDDLVKTYCDSLEKYLKQYKYKGNTPTCEDIKKEIERTELTGLFDAVNQLRGVYLTPDEIPDYEKITEDAIKNNKTISTSDGMYKDIYSKNMKRILRRALDKHVITDF